MSEQRRFAAIVIGITLVAGVSEGAYVLVPRGGTVDVDGDGTADLMVEQCFDCGALPNRIVHINSSFRGFSSDSYAMTDCTDATGASYPSNGPFIPSSGEVYLVKGNSNQFGKIQHNEVSTAAGMELEWQALGCVLPDPPDSDFSFTTYDILGFFTDTSDDDPATSWSWDFDDGGVSSAKNPLHAFPNAGTFNVCLTATNSGGSGPNTCKDVTLTAVPSTTVAPNGFIDFDEDAINDLQVLPTGACGSIPNSLDPLGAVLWTSISQDYRTVGIGDVGTPSSASTFCHPVADIFETVALETSDGSIVKFWTPQNTGGGGVRFEFQILMNSVSPPDSDFTFTTYDLVAFFADTSASDDPTSWSWDFDDGDNSAAQNPLHVFAAAGTYNVCLTASNVGGTGTTTCKDVTVSTVPSTSVPSGDGIDFDGDSIDDLLVVATGACGAIPNLLRPAGGTTWGAISQDYRTVTLGDAPDILSTSDFCHEVADVFSTGFVQTAGAIVKFWTPENDAGGVRFEFEILSVIGDPLTLFTVAPCRLLDTRDADGPLGGPALDALSDRVFAATSVCGIPATAKAIAVNVAVTGSTAAGHLRFHPGGTAVPATSTINYALGQTRSSNSIVSLNGTGEFAVYVGQASGTVHLILDVVGYFE